MYIYMYIHVYDSTCIRYECNSHISLNPKMTLESKQSCSMQSRETFVSKHNKLHVHVGVYVIFIAHLAGIKCFNVRARG